MPQTDKKKMGTKRTAQEVPVQEQCLITIDNKVIAELIANISIKDKDLLNKKVARIKYMLHDLQNELQSISECFEVKV